MTGVGLWAGLTGCSQETDMDSESGFRGNGMPVCVAFGLTLICRMSQAPQLGVQDPSRSGPFLPQSPAVDTFPPQTFWAIFTPLRHYVFSCSPMPSPFPSLPCPPEELTSLW